MNVRKLLQRTVHENVGVRFPGLAEFPLDRLQARQKLGLVCEPGALTLV